MTAVERGPPATLTTGVEWQNNKLDARRAGSKKKRD